MNAQRAKLEAQLLANPRFVLGITGSRDWTGRRSVWVPATAMLRHHRRLAVRNGMCRRGADRLMHEWSERFDDSVVLEIPHPADWDLHGKASGFVRNQEMVDAGMNALMVWANPCPRRTRWCPPGEHPSHGTADCVEKARAAGITIHFSPEGMSW